MLCRAENSSEGSRSHSIDLDAPVTVWRRTIAPQLPSMRGAAARVAGECDTDGRASPSPLSLMSGCGCCHRSHPEFEEEIVLYAPNGGGHWLRRAENVVVYSCCGEGGKPGRRLKPGGGREHGAASAAGESGWSVPPRLRQDKKFLPCTMFAIFSTPLRTIFSSTPAL